MAATNKADLLKITRKEYNKLTGLIAPIDDRQALINTDDVSFKDMVGHRAHWIELFLGWYKDGLAGKQVFFPAEG